MEIKPIAYYKTELKGKFGLPRQSGVVKQLRGEIVLEKEYAGEALRGLDGFDYIWLIWGFSLNSSKASASSLTVRPPRLGGNERVGVFASRSPYRPNPLGLSSVAIEGIDFRKARITVRGADLADGTPIYDIKPYLEYADSHIGIRSGFTGQSDWKGLEVEIPQELLDRLSKEESETLAGLLSQDPRPHYHDDPQRIYGMLFADKDVKFRVEGNRLTVTSID